ncbi:hypothetical protein EV174_006237, partial [Coemansia sp. RSA 2320]
MNVAAAASGVPPPPASKRLAALGGGDAPTTRKRSRTGGSKDLYDGHSQDVMLAKALIDPDHQCSVTTVKAYVTHVCAWFRYCRTLASPSYTVVDEAKLSGFLTWATQTPRLPCKAGGGGSMSYQSARRYVEGGILALWRRHRRADDENPLHALGYLNTKYAIREATAGGPAADAKQARTHTAVAIGAEQEDAVVRALLAAGHDGAASIRAWAYYCLGASTWIPGARRLHLRLDSLVLAARTDARLVEHTTVGLVEFRVRAGDDATARFAEVAVARHVRAAVCPWFAVAALVFMQWQARPSAMAAASLYDVGAWLRQPLFAADTEDALVFLPDDARVRMVEAELAPVLAAAGVGPDHVVRRRDAAMAEALGL